MPRPDNGETACDIGAYEFQDPLVPLRVASGFEVSRRGRCRGRCRTIVLKGRFDSPGKVLVSEFTRIRPGVAVRKLPPRFVRPLAQTVHPGSNALRLRTRPKARRKLLRTGTLKLKLQLQYLPTGGAANSAVQAVNVKRVKKTPR
jgi:hypothetical protein